MTRTLTAQFLSVVRECVVAVDRLQPVAALLSPTGELLDVTSWADRREPPAEWAWPNRRVAVGDDRLIVQDLPDGRPIALVVGAGRFDGTESVDDTGLRSRHPRLFTAVPRTVSGWTFGGQRTADRWWSWGERDGHTWTAGEGGAVGGGGGPTGSGPAVGVPPGARAGRAQGRSERAGSGTCPSDRRHCALLASSTGCRFGVGPIPAWSENLTRVIGSHGGQDVRLAVDGPNVDIRFSLRGAGTGCTTSPSTTWTDRSDSASGGLASTTGRLRRRR